MGETLDVILGGENYAECNVVPSSHNSRDAAMAERLWGVTEGIVAGI